MVRRIPLKFQIKFVNEQSRLISSFFHTTCQMVREIGQESFRKKFSNRIIFGRPQVTSFTVSVTDRLITPQIALTVISGFAVMLKQKGLYPRRMVLDGGIFWVYKDN